MKGKMERVKDETKRTIEELEEGKKEELVEGEDKARVKEEGFEVTKRVKEEKVPEEHIETREHQLLKSPELTSKGYNPN